jgi:hypothetical protein
MANLTNTAEENILDWYFTSGAAPTRPTAWWIGLYTVIPSADDGTGGTECSNTGYARQQVTTFVRTSQTLNPTATLTFGPATENWTEVVAFGVFSAVTSGTLYGFASLTTARTVNNGDSAEFATSDLTITLD